MRIALVEGALAALNRVARWRGRLAIVPAHLRTGMEGEDAACSFLRGKGYLVVERRWSSANQPGDIDLIAWQGPMLCFIEVKARTAHDNSPAEVRVDGHKRRVLRRLARQYMRQLPQETRPQIRFDVLSVYVVPGQNKEFNHFENAFGWNERRQDFD
jgi:putative endonuclease